MPHTNQHTNQPPDTANKRLPIAQLPKTIRTEQVDSNKKTPSWQIQMADLITDIDELLSILKLENLRSQLYSPDRFQLRVPRAFVAKMHIGDPNDPLLRQVLPLHQENQVVAGYSSDPLAETMQNPIQGLLHKYRSRVLVTVTGACAVHCRYCFRQHFDYHIDKSTSSQIQQIQDYIGSHPDINEVILSGGDPLSLSSRRLELWLDAIESIEQIKTIRLHTRLPVVIPERLDKMLNERLHRSRCQIVMVIHTNHANEIDKHTANLLQQTRSCGVTLLNQTVLLSGINDTLGDMVALNKRLFAAGVLPYYLHILDKVAGSAHFNVPKNTAVELYWQMLAELPGYLVPKLVEELPHRPFKTPIDIYKRFNK